MNKEPPDAARPVIRNDVLEECAQEAELEPELPGDPPPEVMEEMRRNPVGFARGVVITTKKNIAAAIRALKREGDAP